MKNLNYQSGNIERKYLKNMPKNQCLEKSLLQLEKDFIDLKD